MSATKKLKIYGLEGPPGYTPVKGVDYFTPAEKQAIVAEAVAQASGVSFHICGEDEVDSNGIPTIVEPNQSTFYLVSSGDEAPNLFIEWAYIDNKWEKFGSATVNMDDYVKKTDYGTPGKAGVVRPAGGRYGINYNINNGVISLATASDTDIINKIDAGIALSPGKIDKIVKTGITTNTETLTLDEQSAVQSWLGVNGIKTIQPDDNGNHSCRLWDLDAGIYHIPTGTKLFYDGATGDKKYILNCEAIMNVTTTNVGKNAYIFEQAGEGCYIVYSFSSATYGGYGRLNFSRLPQLTSTNTWTQPQTFSKQPTITETIPSVSDSSTKIATTKWTQGAIRDKAPLYVFFDTDVDSKQASASETYFNIYAALRSNIPVIGIGMSAQDPMWVKKDVVFNDDSHTAILWESMLCDSGTHWSA